MPPPMVLNSWPGYSFGRHDLRFRYAHGIAAKRSAHGDDGKAVLTLALPDVEDPARPLEMRANVRVAEGSGRPVERSITQTPDPNRRHDRRETDV